MRPIARPVPFPNSCISGLDATLPLTSMDIFDLHSTPNRTILDLRRLGITDMPVIGHYTYLRAAQGLSTETHQEHFEITYLTKGVQIYEANGQRSVLQGGDLHLTLPGESHSTAGQPEEKGEAYWFFLRSPRPTKGVFGLPADATADLVKILRQDRRQARATPALAAHIKEIFRLWPTAAEHPLDAAALKARAELLWIEVAHCFSQEVAQDIAGPVGNAMELLKREGNWDISITDFAKAAHLSEARFKVRFKAETGIPPGEYLIRRRLEKAKFWLRRSPHPIMHIAAELRFPTAQYFATVFKRYTGMRPQDYRDGKR